MKKTLITKAVHLALFASLTSSSAFSAEQEVEQIERIEVTGSKIKRTGMEGVAPLSIITAAEIEASGLTSIADVLQSSVANAGASFGDDVSNSFTVGASSVNLRGMGANRTLVLINGRRQAAFPTASGGTDNFVDVSDIPTSAVERVEILTGGASAIYGSDAIGGVVNIILKDNYEGSKVSVKFENPEAGGRDVFKFSFTQGIDTEKSNTVLMFEYTDSEELLYSDRQEYFEDGLNRIYNTKGYVPSDNHFDAETGEQLAWTEGWDWGGAYPSSWGANIVDYSKIYHEDKYPVTQEQCNELMGDNAVWYTESSYKCRFDKYQNRGLSSATERANLIVNSEYELSADWTLFGMLNISYKDNDSFKDKKGDTEYFYQNEDTGEYTIDKPDADYNRFQLRRRYVEFAGSDGSRHYVSEDQKYSFAVGATGSIGDYDLDVAWSTGYNRYNVDYNNQISAAGIESIITFDPNDADTSKWYPLDKMTPEQVDVISGISTKRSSSRIHQFTSTLTGDLMELPAGDLSFATSFEWAQESYTDIIDETTQTGGFLGRGGTGGEGSRDRYAGALELLVPLLKDVTAVDNLELSLAGRYDYYDDQTAVGGAFSPQVGVMYHPTENVLIRGSWGKSFRAPDMHRVYAGTTIGFGETEYELPDGSIYEDSYRSISSGSLTLEEEKGEYSSIGIVADITDNFDMTLDWWSIELEGAVRTISTSDIYAGPNDYNPAYEYTGQFATCNELPGPGFMLNTDDDGFENLDCIKKAPFNSAMEKSEGVDVEFIYRFDSQYGDFKAKIAASYLKLKEVQDKVSLPIENYVDTYYYPTWKSNASLTWSKGDFTSTLSYYYTGTATGEDLFEYEDTDGNEIEEYRTDKLAAYGRLNWSASIKFDDMGRLKLGIKNITDEMPPLYDIRNKDSLSDPWYRTSRGYSTVGRTFYVGYDYTF